MAKGLKPKAPKVDAEATQAEEMEAIQVMAATIRTDLEFITVLATVNPPQAREAVYDLIAPHVHPSYSPRPFALMSFEDA